MRRLATLLACTLLAAIGAVAGVSSSVQNPTFRSSVDVVDVDVSVLDKNRLPVVGLKADDFTVLEGGQLRPVVAFSAVDLPPRELPTAPWMADIAPDVISNAFPREGRLIAILIDRSIAAEDRLAARKYAEAAVDLLRPGDLAAVAFSTFGVPQNFTADRARLKQVINQPFVGLPQGEDGSASGCMCGSCTLDSVGRIAEAMQEVRQRRKLLFVLSSRISIQSSGTCAGMLTSVRNRAFRALEAGNVTVHVIDPAGIQTDMPTASTSSPTAGDRNALASLRRLGNLRVLPEHTGGQFVGANPIRPADLVAELYRESDSYYVLGFHPTTTDRSSRFHNIQVKVNRRGVTLQARRGFYSLGAAIKDETKLPATMPTALRTAIKGLWPETTIPIAMNLVPFSTPALDGAILAVTLDVTQQIDERGPVLLADAPPGASPASTRANVLVGAFDRNGKALAFDRQTLVIAPRRVSDRQFEYQVLMRLDLRPGRYEIRAAIEDETLGRSGSVYGYVDIPDFRQQAVTLSGLVLTVSRGVPSTPLGSLGGILPVVPTARRQFTSADEVTAFARLYQGLSRPATPGYLTSEVRDDRDRVVFHQETRITTESMGAGRATDLTLDVPLSRLSVGSYLFVVQSRHGSEIARRDVRFDITGAAR